MGNNRKGYIGEKGIGFKSVFEVADVVWIKSGALTVGSQVLDAILPTLIIADFDLAAVQV